MKCCYDCIAVAGGAGNYGSVDGSRHDDIAFGYDFGAFFYVAYDNDAFFRFQNLSSSQRTFIELSVSFMDGFKALIQHPLVEPFRISILLNDA